MKAHNLKKLHSAQASNASTMHCSIKNHTVLKLLMQEHHQSTQPQKLHGVQASNVSGPLKHTAA